MLQALLIITSILLFIFVFLKEIAAENKANRAKRHTPNISPKRQKSIFIDKEAEDPVVTEHLIKEFRTYKSRYLRSKQWYFKRNLIRSRDKACKLCNSKLVLQVHHISYRNLTNEPLKDLILLCDKCHKAQHEKFGYPKTPVDYMKFKDTDCEKLVN